MGGAKNLGRLFVNAPPSFPQHTLNSGQLTCKSVILFFFSFFFFLEILAKQVSNDVVTDKQTTTRWRHLAKRQLQDIIPLLTKITTCDNSHLKSKYFYVNMTKVLGIVAGIFTFYTEKRDLGGFSVPHFSC